MGRTDWGMVILGGGALVGIAYAFFNWKTLCPQILGAQNCNNGLAGIFGGTLTGSGIAQGYGQIYKPDPTKPAQIIDPQKVVTGSSAKVNTKASIPSKPKLQASGSASIGAGAHYTDFNSFNTITLNRMSVR